MAVTVAEAAYLEMVPRFARRLPVSRGTTLSPEQDVATLQQIESNLSSAPRRGKDG
jgi:hypothetical protein